MNLPNTYQTFLSQSPSVRKILSRIYYQVAAPYIDRAEFSFMNYGYAELETTTRPLTLDESDEPNRLPIQLYHFLASSVAIEGRDVLEVSCGRGGGAAFVSKYHHPHSMMGIDLTAKAIAYCRRKHHRAGLSFMQGDAQALVFGNECFDVVLNVEASHLYSSMDAFLSEVRRVLRPGGHLLLVDKRMTFEVRLLRQQVADSGMQKVVERDISANVLQSIRLQNVQRVRRLEKHLPEFLVWLGIKLIGVDGSHLKNALDSGHTIYLGLVLRKE